jgi:hypothetical protein
MASSQFSNAQWPQGSIAFKGNMSVNGYPAGPKDSYLTLGGFIDANDVNNASVIVAPFGNFVSAAVGTGDAWVLGLPSGYIARGVLLVDESIMYNEPAKSTGYGLGLDATVMYRGPFRLSSWTANGSGSLTTPYLGCVPIVNIASGYIEFQPSGTVSAPTGFQILTGNGGGNALKFVDIDPLLGSSAVGGVLLYLSLY